MKIKSITYGRVINKGNCQNAKIEVQCDLDETDDFEKSFSALKKIVSDKCELEKITEDAIERAKYILENKDDYTVGQIKESIALLIKAGMSLNPSEELPF